ncbi:hypothetical protein [Winogradskyella luteola]|uniref:Outer membrane protein beta-barrel domain-containing protein n=1 Tax=Winogradskyella luteola TaxID=2828330 RepID=A0A9X1F8F3_9FLAO|nr:hypothetical protein [Winogradskyella luteola]MBV7269262.1 hypothetical protein [Winogradskyella luteola]
MNTITRLVVYTIIAMTFATVQGQDRKLDSIRKVEVDEKINDLENEKTKIEAQEKEILKLKISKINKRLDKKEITAEEAENLKKEAAKIAALNIETRTEIINGKIALLNRNGYDAYQHKRDDDGFILRIGGDENTSESFIYIGEKSQDKPRKYDRRTTEDVVFAIGFNNALIDGQSIDDSPYKIGGSGFLELGYAWKTRIFDNTNFWRLKYGFSFQWNKLDIKDDQYFVNNDDEISLQEFPSNLDKAKFRTTNLVFPVHLEFGPSKKIEKEDYFRYSTRKKLKIGLGGYAGLNIGSMQKLKYKEDGNRIKDKQRGGFEVSSFVYGLSGYVALGEVALYVKYDLNPLFKNQAIDQNNISVGVRFDMD